MKYVIIGGVAGGATAAARIRRNDEQAQIVLFEKGQYISYANCGLPYYIGNVITEREKLILQTPTSFGNRYDVDVRNESEIISINKDEKSVTVRNSRGKEYKESYDRLLLSPGAIPLVPPFALNKDGNTLPGIFTIRNVDDIDKIKSFLCLKEIKSAVVVGAGFIGLEMAENLQLAGISVSVVEMLDQVMPPVDYPIAAPLQLNLAKHGISLLLGRKVSKICAEGGELMTIEFENGESISTEAVILSIGVRPNTALAKGADIALGTTGGILVDEYLRTNQDNIYAVGDAIEFVHPITKKPWLNYLAGPANRQARIVADNMVFGDKIAYEGSIGTAIAKVFELSVGMTGLSAKKLKAEGINFSTAIVHPSSHAGYYPGATQLTLQICFDPKNGKLLGAQGIGHEGVDKRVDQMAAVIKNGGTIWDLIRTEQCYAPPFSSAKDPVAIAGYVAENIILGKVQMIDWETMRDADPSQVMILDVRSMEENKAGAIAGSVNIPVDELRLMLDEVPQDKPIYLYCAIGLRGYLASRILLQNGYTQVYNLAGGFKTFRECMAAEKR